ncbi:hypothetical protein GQ44DRAFT_702790 [Phaeosphaeriaceae sp. PMI808]|nr:hypothetical protein GQ44DRAFT_702790 [Phaeosphaeriaceae sp. PMI808]
MKGSWLCSRFVNGDKGLDGKLIALVKAAKRLQWNAMYPLPAIAAGALFILWITFLLSRDRSETGKRYAVVGLWASCAIGFAAALIPMMLGQALHFAGPVYGSNLKMKINVLSIVFTWVAFANHLAYVGLTVWRDKRDG